jgi:hypothetical protein
MRPSLWSTPATFLKLKAVIFHKVIIISSRKKYPGICIFVVIILYFSIGGRGEIFRGAVPRAPIFHSHPFKTIHPIIFYNFYNFES